MTQNFYITTAISYPNGAPHIGHVYELIATDVIARYHRLAGACVHFVSGSDDHGQKIYQTARAAHKTPQALTDELTPEFRQLREKFNCTYDDFIRTSEPRHHAAVTALWNKLEAAGDIYKDKYEGWYSIRDEAFYTEDELTINTDNVRLSPQGTPVDWIVEESYFFRLSAYQTRLLEFYDANPNFIAPESARNEIIAFVSRGLKDLSISRTSFDWGVPVPNASTHIVYVWLDALTNYLTALGYPDTESALWKYWPAALHIIGKDVTRFHAIYWPAFLMSAELACPQRIFAHGFLTTHSGEKISKSQGNALAPDALSECLSSDAVRYFLMRDIPFGRDGSMSTQALITRVNADLANDIRNLAQRCLSMPAKELDGTVPVPNPTPNNADATLLAYFQTLRAKTDAAICACMIHSYLSELFAAVAQANRYFAANEPWKLKKSDPVRMAQVLYITAECTRQAAILLQPVAPVGASILLDNLAVDVSMRDFAHLSTPLAAATKLPAPQIAFPRIHSASQE